MHLKDFMEPIGQHSVLNPKIWEHNRLKSSVRGALMRISEDFLNFVDVPINVADIVLAGSNANYTYTNKSDLDLHIIADLSNVQCDREVEELFDTKRILYRLKYDLTIENIPVELYVEDLATPAVSSSFSILKNQWVQKPKKEIHEYDHKKLEHMVNVWKTILQHTMKTGDLQSCRKAVKLLRTYRIKGLHTSAGEYSIPNLVYKSLRNDDTLIGITRFIDQLHSKQLSS